MDRRTFIQSLPLTALLPSVLSAASLKGFGFGGDPDEEICLSKFSLAVSAKLQALPIGDAMVEIGKSFIGAEYVAHTLEQTGEEHLVINLRGFDCVSFYENCLVLARCIRKNEMTFAAYKRELQFIRYRGGVIDGYTSRLHYTSDYFHDNVVKGIVRDVTKEIGGIPYVKTINFMSTHTDAYRQLKENPALVKVVEEQERAISAREKFYLPKDKVAAATAKLQNGDIVGITTSLEGMDVAHTGIIVKKEGVAHFMHAPITGAKVQITDGPIADYLARIKKDTGIMVVRPVDPKA